MFYNFGDLKVLIPLTIYGNLFCFDKISFVLDIVCIFSSFYLLLMHGRAWMSCWSTLPSYSRLSPENSYLPQRATSWKEQMMGVLPWQWTPELHWQRRKPSNQQQEVQDGELKQDHIHWTSSQLLQSQTPLLWLQTELQINEILLFLMYFSHKRVFNQL